MSPSRRSIIFARIPESLPLPAGFKIRPSTRVLVNDEASGWIVADNGLLNYLLADGNPSGLPSTAVRADLERQILLFHLGTLTGDAAVTPAELFRAAS